MASESPSKSSPRPCYHAKGRGLTLAFFLSSGPKFAYLRRPVNKLLQRQTHRIDRFGKNSGNIPPCRSNLICKQAAHICGTCSPVPANNSSRKESWFLFSFALKWHWWYYYHVVINNLKIQNLVEDRFDMLKLKIEFFLQHNFFSILSLKASAKVYGTPDACQQGFSNLLGITSLFFIYK